MRIISLINSLAKDILKQKIIAYNYIKTNYLNIKDFVLYFRPKGKEAWTWQWVIM